MQFPDRGDDAADLFVTETQRVPDGIFGNLQPSSLDHDDRFFAPDNDDVEQALFLLGRGWIGDELALQQSHANCGNWLFKRQIGNKCSRRCAGHGNYVRIIFAVGG